MTKQTITYCINPQTPASIITAPGVAAKMSLNQLDQALSDESYDAVFKPYLTEALNHMVASMFAGEAMVIKLHIVLHYDQ